MRRRIAILLSAVSLALGLATVCASPISLALDCSNPSALSASQQLECGANGASGQANANPSDATSNVNHTITRLINLLSVIVGVVAVIMVIVAGFRYITSGGKQESVTSAKNTLLYAVIGLVIVALAQVIVRFVLTQATSCPTGQHVVSGNCVQN